ncbi:outer membrane beta-barrel domain-containing protein [Teredinibacter haidensis]|uniref:outer membrane beta-barrel domain-containing protein n=1 Tax=Teredinibacter haidensis TaxID=2731755 RepID=UPI000948A466|nr:outer membrane beta-barrel domain-containing protein [Teredinibacter haidensis]
MRFIRTAVFSIVVLSGSPWALCDENDRSDVPEVTIIQERIFDKKNEVGLSLGYLPDDNFYEAFPVTINYIHHFDEHYAWEVIRASYMLNNERDIKRDLEENFGVTPSTFDEFVSHIETSFIVKPTYGKDSLWNKLILNHEGYFSFGAGVATYEKKFSYDSPQQESALTVSVGIGRKYFFNRSVNISLDLKEIVVFKEDTTESSVYMGVGFNYRFDLFGSMRKIDEESSSIYKYLN